MKEQLIRTRVCFFDCDGVIFDSNGFKLQAMSAVLAGYPEQLRLRMREYWQSNGGMSRRAKFEHFFTEMVPVPDPLVSTEQAVVQFRQHSYQGYLASEPLPGALELARWLGRERAYVTSGAEQQELQRVFRVKQIDGLFAEVLGSPRTKRELVWSVLQSKRVAIDQALMIGDGAHDYQVCQELGIHFVYLAKYSEWRAARQVLAQAPAVTWCEDWPRLLGEAGIC